MKLIDAISNLSIYSDRHIIYVKSSQSIDENTEVVVMLSSEFEARRKDMEDYDYFLEIPLVEDVINAWRYNTNELPTSQQIVRAVIYYAENDAYLMPDE
jgi:hypothetical protein